MVRRDWTSNFTVHVRIARPCTRMFGPRMGHCRGDRPVARMDLSTSSHGRPAGRPYTEPMFPEGNPTIRAEATDVNPPDSHRSLWLDSHGRWYESGRTAELDTRHKTIPSDRS